MRVFIGLRLSDATKEYIKKINAQLVPLDTRGRFTPERNLHITAAFLGETGTEEARRLVEVVKNTASKFAAPDISLDRLVNFGAVLSVSAVRNSALTGLQGLLNSELKAQGFYTEGRPYRPHVTVARDFSSVLPLSELNKRVMIINRPHAAESLVLFESVRAAGGMEYNPLCQGFFQKE